MSLKRYWQKRDFSKTTEPKGKVKKDNNCIFVIQKHHASHLHYDFRLEVEGVLKSWAVPKGLPERLSEKKLAIQTEDHPIKYAEFEGTIPEGEYGAGTVEILDSGTYQNITMGNNKLISINKALELGHVDVILKGKKVKGAFTLILFKEEKGYKQWLLIRKRKA